MVDAIFVLCTVAKGLLCAMKLEICGLLLKGSFTCMSNVSSDASKGV